MKVDERVRPIEILLIEDNEGDVRLTIEALKEGNVPNNMTVAKDGETAMAILGRQGEFATASRPDIILLDLNLPRKDGREVLEDIKVDDSLKVIPVVVLTTSRDEYDVVKSYKLHANCYVVKPVDLDRFLDVVKTIEEFWFTIVVLPPRKGR